MTTISPNYAGVNFKATEQVQPKKAAETNAQSKPESKGMSNAMKAGIGLAALSVAVIGGLAAKKHIDAKNFPKNFVNIFEKHYGKVPKSCVIVFADGNRDNFEIDNLICISKREHLFMNMRNMFYTNKEYTYASVNLARLLLKISDLNKKRGKSNV